MDPQDMTDTIIGYLNQGYDIAMGWLLSPAAWSQFGLLIAAYLLARLVNRIMTPKLATLLEPPADATSIFATARRFVLQFLPLILPLLAYAFTLLKISSNSTQQRRKLQSYQQIKVLLMKDCLSRKVPL